MLHGPGIYTAAVGARVQHAHNEAALLSEEALATAVKAILKTYVCFNVHC
jgi:hypothetical protein